MAGALGRALDALARRARVSSAGRALLARLAAGYITLCWRTTRWTVEGRENHAAAAGSGGPVIAAFWHGRLFFSPLWAPPGRRAVAMISENRDGALIAAIVARFGVGAVRGSTADPRKPGKDKRGRRAFAGGIEALRAGGVLAITPDGPRGPRMRAQGGAAALSAVARAPVLPIGVSTRRGRFARSWDRFLVPVPFDRGALVWGPLLPPPASDDAAALEAHRRAIEAALTEAAQRADRLAGREPVAPEPLPAVSDAPSSAAG